MSKLASIRFSEFLNTDYGKDGILSFAIHLGGVATELARQMPESMHAILVDTPELAADFIVWLTGERREWLAGRYISANWDIKELLDKKDKIVSEDLLKIRMDVGLD